jgi:hypothetical protein
LLISRDGVSIGPACIEKQADYAHKNQAPNDSALRSFVQYAEDVMQYSKNEECICLVMMDGQSV